MRIIIGALALGLVGGACGKKNNDGGGGAANNLPPQVASWLPAGALDAWQGVWETHVSFADQKNIDWPTALEIKGDHATAWDGTKEHQLTVAITSPCAIGLVEQLGDHSRATYTKFFLMQGGKLVAVGDGAAGYRKGKAAIACRIGADGVDVLDDAGTCLEWKPDFMDKTKWKSAPETCAWTAKDGKDVLNVGTGGFASELIANGDLLEAEQLTEETTKQEFMKRATDYAAAKAWVTAEVAKK